MRSGDWVLGVGNGHRGGERETGERNGHQGWSPRQGWGEVKPAAVAPWAEPATASVLASRGHHVPQPLPHPVGTTVCPGTGTAAGLCLAPTRADLNPMGKRSGIVFSGGCDAHPAWHRKPRSQERKPCVGFSGRLLPARAGPRTSGPQITPQTPRASPAGPQFTPSGPQILLSDPPVGSPHPSPGPLIIPIRSPVQVSRAFLQIPRSPHQTPRSCSQLSKPRELHFQVALAAEGPRTLPPGDPAQPSLERVQSPSPEPPGAPQVPPDAKPHPDGLPKATKCLLRPQGSKQPQVHSTALCFSISVPSPPFPSPPKPALIRGAFGLQSVGFQLRKGPVGEAPPVRQGREVGHK